MKNFRLDKPCSENWNKMQATTTGAFCSKCSIEVIDFTKRSKEEIKSIFQQMGTVKFCGKISRRQIEEMETDLLIWQQTNDFKTFQSKWLLALVLVFGLSLFSCETEKDRITISRIHQTEIKERSTSLIEKVEKKNNISNAEVEKKEIPVLPTITIINEPVDFHQEEGIPIRENVLTKAQLDQLPEYDDVIVGGMALTSCMVTYVKRTAILEEPEHDQNGIFIPRDFQSKIFPNPAVEATTLEIGLPLADFFTIQLFDASGRFIQSIYEGQIEKGTHRFPLDFSEAVSGIYFVAIHSEKYNETIKVLK